jgi:multiple sugar transport system permease protein
VIPIAYGVYLSLFDSTILVDGEFVGLQNYVELLTDIEFLIAIWRGVLFAVGNVALQVGLGLVIALVLHQRPIQRAIAKYISISLGKFARAAVLTFTFLPYLVPVIALAYTWRWLLAPRSGIFIWVASLFGAVEPTFSVFGTQSTAMLSVIIADSWKYTSFAVILILARLQGIPTDLYEQAKTCGANSFHMFRDITLPHLRSTILLVAFLRAVWMFHKFDSIWLLTRGGPIEATTTMPVLIYRMTFLEYELSKGSAAAIIFFLMVVAFAVLYFKLFSPDEEIEAR